MKTTVVRIGHKVVLLEVTKVKEFAYRLHNIADNNSCSYAVTHLPCDLPNSLHFPFGIIVMIGTL